ncbi:TPA: hypothetical protein U0560_000782 [Streptococcus suis]|uniref:Lipoprotein n=3 Tax=Streptococcus suis TaxID=1307 RepID=A0A0Z8JN85_STRSU|nr:hypothetical protein [Streptococcus suis]AIG42640.1 hypothetical protein ID09_00615 [Streptococcus suis 6407]MBL6441059.1 hypothetical protein [Streptococcus suis]MBL6516094.1 hypothetical protein [Streptococcus suis]MCK3921036.1 hypothetical protein [Streptococcus suis]MCK3952578.1 hypothetical protein [Streptococcus suis]
MKSKTILTNLVLLATSTMLIACSNNNSSINEKSSPTTEQTSNVDSIENFIKNNKDRINSYRDNYYDSGMSSQNLKLQREAEKKNEQIYLTANDVDPRLTKLKVELGEYNHDTKRLEVKVTNNYSEDIIGINDNTKESNELRAGFTIKGYFMERTGIKLAGTIMSVQFMDSIKSGETVTLNILMPYYEADRISGKQDYANAEMDSKYKLMDVDNESRLVYPNNDQGQLGMNAMSNYSNIFTETRLVFNEYPKEAYITDEEIVEYYNMMKD